jgi:hypothetical protein
MKKERSRRTRMGHIEEDGIINADEPSRTNTNNRKPKRMEWFDLVYHHKSQATRLKFVAVFK